MSKGVTTVHGLKYTLPDKVFDDVDAADGGTNRIWNQINAYIEAADLLPSFIGTIIFCVLSYMKMSPWYMIPIYSFLGIALALILSKSFYVFKIPFLVIFLSIFQYFTRFMLHLLIVILVAVFVIQNWLAALVYIVGSFVLQGILVMVIGGYEKREGFNVRVAYAALKKYSQY